MSHFRWGDTRSIRGLYEVYIQYTQQASSRLLKLFVSQSPFFPSPVLPDAWSKGLVTGRRTLPRLGGLALLAHVISQKHARNSSRAGDCMHVPARISSSAGRSACASASSTCHTESAAAQSRPAQPPMLRPQAISLKNIPGKPQAISFNIPEIILWWDWGSMLVY